MFDLRLLGYRSPMPLPLVAREAHVPLDGARLFCREIGEGHPLVVLHGGPDFDHQYLLPDLDVLADRFRLLYYDQRGRGRSAEGVRAGDVSIASEVVDLESLRRHFGFESFALLGHSWGGLLALEYATRHPDHLSHLILMNTAPASPAGRAIMREELARKRDPHDAAKMDELAGTAAWNAGDLDVEAEYYLCHFRSTVRPAEKLEGLVRRLQTRATPEGVVKARAIRQRLYDDTWLASGWNLLPALRRLDLPTLLLHGDEDFIPVAVAEEIASAMPGARFVVLEGCGHFPFLDRLEAMHGEIAAFVGGA